MRRAVTKCAIGGDWKVRVLLRYASVLDQSMFRTAVSRTMKISSREVSELDGICLPWESRKKINIYVAAPDFKAADRSQIDKVVSCLQYHNFIPRRPVVENGEITSASDRETRAKTASADVRLLRECQILLAVPIFDDPGTYIEMGYALQIGMPVIVYAPYRITENLLSAELPILTSSDLDEIVTEIFKQAAKIDFK